MASWPKVTEARDRPVGFESGLLGLIPGSDYSDMYSCIISQL